MSKYRKFFTVEEANTLIPKLSVIVEGVREIKEEIASQIPELESVVSKAKINGGHKNGTNYTAKLAEFYDHLNAITEIRLSTQRR